MYVLIYDENVNNGQEKKVLSVHRSRKTAERALDNRMKKLKKRVTDCNARIVWVEDKVRSGDYVRPTQFSTWRPGEEIPWGEMHSDED